MESNPPHGLASNRFVVLDRDGVINEDSADYIKSPEEWVPVVGSVEGMAALSAAGIRIAVVTNQSGLARRYFDTGAINRMHHKLRNLVVARGGQVEMILFCPHGPDEQCECRKPGVGLLKELARRSGTGLRGMPFIGDSLSDIQAAWRFGMQPYLVLTGKGKQTLAGGAPELQHARIFSSLKSAADEIISRWSVS